MATPKATPHADRPAGHGERTESAQDDETENRTGRTNSNSGEEDDGNDIGWPASASVDPMEPSDGNDDTDDRAATRRPAKQRHTSDGTEIGAVQVNERAPRVNRRFYLGLTRPSVRARNARERARRRGQRRASDADDGDSRDEMRRVSGEERAPLQGGVPALESGNSPRGVLENLSTLMASLVPREFLVSANLVEQEQEELAVAERVGFFERKWKQFTCILCFLLLLMAVLVSVMIKNVVELPSAMPCMQPSYPPSFDPRPTLEIVQARGHIQCGLDRPTIESGVGFRLDMCRSVAAVLFGNPERIEMVPITPTTNFGLLNDRYIDLLLGGATYTIEREVRERTTGVGYTFSSPFYYDGVAYFGNETFVRCAEEKKRYGECASLRVCVVDGSTGIDFVRFSFPSDFLAVGSSFDQMIERLRGGECNAVAADRFRLLDVASDSENEERGFVVGDKVMTNGPLAIVTRDSDREFSDIINWVVQALFYGEERGLVKDPSRCKNYTGLVQDVSDLEFLNAVHCVGSYGEIFYEDKGRRSINQINDGTTGMLFAVPFGKLDYGNEATRNIDSVAGGSRLGAIRNKGLLNCGVIDGAANSDELAGMSFDFCHTLAAALFNGKHGAVTFLTYPDEEEGSFAALDNGTIDVLSGVRVNRKHDFKSSPSLRGFQFSTPYYYGNETAGDDVSFFSLATRETDSLVSSFVNCVVLAILYAKKKGIIRERSRLMPLVTLFGSEFNWALRDAISYSGNYDEIYTKHFGDVLEELRGRNVLNNGGPQIHSIPGFHH